MLCGFALKVDAPELARRFALAAEERWPADAGILQARFRVEMALGHYRSAIEAAARLAESDPDAPAAELRVEAIDAAVRWLEDA